MFFRKKTIADIRDKELISLAQARSKFDILVIDDAPFIANGLLSKRGYNLKESGDINNVRFVEKFEIILCDIKGVGKTFGSQYEGAYLIKEIKSYYPYKYVIGYSGSVFDASFNEYTKYCDKMAVKDTSPDDWQSLLDDGLRKICDPVEKWHTIRNHLAREKIETESIIIFEDSYVRAMLDRSPDRLLQLSKSPIPKLARDIAVNLAASAIWSALGAPNA